MKNSKKWRAKATTWRPAETSGQAQGVREGRMFQEGRFQDGESNRLADGSELSEGGLKSDPTKTLEKRNSRSVNTSRGVRRLSPLASLPFLEDVNGANKINLGNLNGLDVDLKFSPMSPRASFAVGYNSQKTNARIPF